MSKKRKFLPKLILFFIILFPIVGLLVTKYFSDTKLQMPKHYNIDRILEIPGEDGDITYDTIFHRMRPFAFVNQLGDTIGLDDIDNSFVLVNFFQTKDSTRSLQANKTLKKLTKSFAQSDTALQVLSFTIDPMEDSVPVLLDYALDLQVNHSVWWFLNGPADSVRSIAKNDFDLKLNPKGSQYLLSSPTLVLLDRFQHVRGYYNLLDSVDVKRCVHELSLLMIEKEKLNGVER